MKRRKNNNTFKMPGVYQEHVASSVAVNSTEDAETASETLAYLNEIAKIINAKNNKSMGKAQSTDVSASKTKIQASVVGKPVSVSTMTIPVSTIKKKINVVDYKVYKDVNLINQENLKKIKRETTSAQFTGFKLDPDESSTIPTCQQCSTQQKPIVDQYVIVNGQQVIINPKGLYKKYLVMGNCLGNLQDTVTYIILKPYIHNYQHLSESDLLELLETEVITK